MTQLFTLSLHHDQDVVTARQRAAQVAALLGFDISEQTRIATAVSEIVRNAFRYTGGGEVTCAIDLEVRPQRLIATVADTGRGIPHLDDVLAGRYRSATGMGIGISGARRLMDRFDVRSSDRGTIVTLEKELPARGPFVTIDRARAVTDALRHRPPQGLVEEIQRQNQDLLRTLDELQRRQQELTEVNRELEDTNRGVVALYAELDDKADHLRRADELKSRFLSNMTHEFRTPVNSIIGLCNLLVDDRQREGRDVEPEIGYIRKAADQLSDLVNDLLDLAKVEAGKTVVRPADVDVEKLFGALRGMLRPLLLNQAVALVFEDAAGLPRLRTDEPKLSQILRNLISNALKFTERGEVRVSAAVEDAEHITFRVKDTGIGIAIEDQPRIFEEFTQLEHRLQRVVRGTGLGLPLSRRLAELLGGSLTVESNPGQGSTFTVTLPVNYSTPRAAASASALAWARDPDRLPLLVVEDASDEQYFYERAFANTPFQVFPARTLEAAEAALEVILPSAVILDVVLNDEESWHLLERLKGEERTREIPVVVVSAIANPERALAVGADAYLVKPVDRRALVDTLLGVAAPQPRATRVLIVDDEEVSRYLMRQCLPIPAFELTEADDAETGLERARAEQPDVILLDLVLPGMNGAEALRQLRRDPATREIPVIIVTNTALEPPERQRLLADADDVLSKADLSRETLGDAVRRRSGRARL